MPSITRKAQADRAQRRDEIKQRLLEATYGLLSGGESYTELSVERLVEAAGISRSTFYVYFQDKGHLLRELTGDVLGEVGEIGRTWWERGPDITRAELHDVMTQIVHTYRRHDALLRAVADTAVYDETVRQVSGPLLFEFVDEIAAMIERSGAGEAEAKEMPARETAALLTWMAERSCYQMAPGAEPDALDRLARAMTTVVWNTLYRHRAGGDDGRAGQARPRP